MFALVLAIIILGFGIFLKTTKDPGFASSKKMAWLLIGVGLISLLGKIIIMYQTGEL